MMTFTSKLQLGLIRDVLDGKTAKHFGFGEKTAISTDGYVACIFDPEELVFDLGTDRCVELGQKYGDRYFDMYGKAYPLNRTREFKFIGSYLVERLYCDCEKPFDVFVNKEYLEKFPDCTFTGVSPLDPVFASLPIYGTVGMIMPMRDRKGQQK